MKDLMDHTLPELRAQAHPRTLIVATANAAIAAAIAQVEQKYDLTHYELVKCLSDYLSISMKYALRWGRHGNSEIGADEPPVATLRPKKAVR
jgi:hypothetical protein